MTVCCPLSSNSTTTSTSQNKGQESKGNNISEAQQKRRYALCSGRSEIGKEVIKGFGYESSKDILIKDCDAICEKITVRMVRAEYEEEMSKAYCSAWEYCDIGLMERGSGEE